MFFGNQNGKIVRLLSWDVIKFKPIFCDVLLATVRIEDGVVYKHTLYCSELDLEGGTGSVFCSCNNTLIVDAIVNIQNYLVLCVIRVKREILIRKN